MDDKYAVGNFIYELRRERGYTQKELAALLDVTDKAVSKWETGAAAPRRSVLRKLAGILGCTQEELLQGRRIEAPSVPQDAEYREASCGREAGRDEDGSEAFWEKVRKLIWQLELVVLLLLAILTAVFGFQRGIWERSTFFRAGADGDRRIYAGRNGISVEVTTGPEQNRIVFRSEDGQTARLLFRISQSSASKTVLILLPEGSPILSNTYFNRDREWSPWKDGSQILNDRIRESDHFSPGLSDPTICRMASGLEETRVLGRSRDFLLALLCLALGLSFRFLTKAIFRLDRAVLGIFYRDADRLRANELAQVLLAASGIILFGIGLVMYGSILFA